ncbi:hypothetical protein BCU12_11620 [Vibrio sp. 10N.261.55.A7]|nr:hypothetical protein BCU12_11620 [Vibrio sp. 10N.261.55.A7]
MFNIAAVCSAKAFCLANQQHIGFTLESVSQASDFRQLFSNPFLRQIYEQFGIFENKKNFKSIKGG